GAVITHAARSLDEPRGAAIGLLVAAGVHGGQGACARSLARVLAGGITAARERLDDARSSLATQRVVEACGREVLSAGGDAPGATAIQAHRARGRAGGR